MPEPCWKELNNLAGENRVHVVTAARFEQFFALVQQQITVYTLGTLNTSEKRK